MLENIYIVRHSDAVDINDFDVKTDADRYLSEDGKIKMEEVSKGIKKLGISFDKIFTSPYIRARETADILADVLDCKDIIEEIDCLVPFKSPNDVIDYLIQNNQYQSVALVGHNPLLAELLSVLISEYPDAGIKVKKASLARLKVSSLSRDKIFAYLDMMLSPKQLKMIK